MSCHQGTRAKHTVHTLQVYLNNFLSYLILSYFRSKIGVKSDRGPAHTQATRVGQTCPDDLERKLSQGLGLAHRLAQGLLPLLRVPHVGDVTHRGWSQDVPAAALFGPAHPTFISPACWRCHTRSRANGRARTGCCCGGRHLYEDSTQWLGVGPRSCWVWQLAGQSTVWF